MRKILTILFCLIALAVEAKVDPADLQKGLLRLSAYDAQGRIVSTSSAFFLTEDGEAAASYHALIGAVRAEVTDYKGRSYAVLRITGANASSDLVKFTTSAAKADPLIIATVPASENAALNVPDNLAKKVVLRPVKIISDEAYGDYRYYALDLPNDSLYNFLPVLNDAGEVCAVVQPNVRKNAVTACAMDARLIRELSIKPASALNSDLRALAIPKALPADKKEALTYIYMLAAADSLSLAIAHNDFVNAYPKETEGFVNRAAFEAERGHYAAAQADFETALARAKSDSTGMNLHTVYYQISDVLYRTIIARRDTVAPRKGWTLQAAEEAVDRAIESSPFTLYLMQKAKCCYARRNYQKAYETFRQVTKDSLFATPETFYSAANALEMAGGDSLEVIALLDMCIERIPSNATEKYAPYYLYRATRLVRAGDYRKAVGDFNKYEQLVGPKNLTANFYYYRHTAELEARMYQQALDDIRTAIATSDAPLPFRLDEAYLFLRVGEFKMAIEAAESLLQDLPENPDCYKIIGISLGELGRKAEAIKNLEKAIQLGDTTLEPLIKKYQ